MSSSGSDTEKQKEQKDKKKKYTESSSSEDKDGTFVSDILSSQPPPYNTVQGPQNVPDPTAGCDSASGNRGITSGFISQVPAVQLPQPFAPPLPQPESTRLETTADVVVRVWTDEGASTSSVEPQTQRLDPINVGLLKIEFEEIVDGTIGSSRLEIYNKEEMKYIMKVTMMRAGEALNDLRRAAEEHEADITGNKIMRTVYRTEFTEEDINQMDIPSLRSHIQALI